MEDARNIYLIGLMGAGKTTVGRLLAKRLGWQFLDTDQHIVERTGVSISTIFEIEGEAGFRRRERAAIDELTARQNTVLATGGGVILDASNRQRLHLTGWVVYLDISPSVIFKRMSQRHDRPLLRVDNPLAKLKELKSEREALYRETAHYVVNTAAFDAHAIVRLLLSASPLNRPQTLAPNQRS